MQQAGYIILVESDDLIRNLAEGWLGEAGYRVVTAAQQGSVTTDKPRLVIANVSNPRAASSLIRLLHDTYSAPILLLSARFPRGLGGSRGAARQLGVCRVLPKPFSRQELLSAVRAALADR
jgi:DNA-binding response OmpR family regulator